MKNGNLMSVRVFKPVQARKDPLTTSQLSAHTDDFFLLFISATKVLQFLKREIPEYVLFLCWKLEFLLQEISLSLWQRKCRLTSPKVLGKIPAVEGFPGSHHPEGREIHKTTRFNCPSTAEKQSFLRLI